MTSTLVISSQPGKGRTCRKIFSTPGGRRPNAKHVVGEILERASRLSPCCLCLSVPRSVFGGRPMGRGPFHSIRASADEIISVLMKRLPPPSPSAPPYPCHSTRHSGQSAIQIRRAVRTCVGRAVVIDFDGGGASTWLINCLWTKIDGQLEPISNPRSWVEECRRRRGSSSL